VTRCRLGAAAVWNVAGPAVSQDAVPRLRADHGHGARGTEPAHWQPGHAACQHAGSEFKFESLGRARPGPGLLLSGGGGPGRLCQDLAPASGPLNLKPEAAELTARHGRTGSVAVTWVKTEPA
jgi:hypothetical protein